MKLCSLQTEIRAAFKLFIETDQLPASSKYLKHVCNYDIIWMADLLSGVNMKERHFWIPGTDLPTGPHRRKL